MEFIQLTAGSNGLKAHRCKHSYKLSLIIVINLIKHKSIKEYSVYTIHFKIQLIKILFLIKRFIFFLAFFFYEVNLFASIQKILCFSTSKYVFEIYPEIQYQFSSYFSRVIFVHNKSSKHSGIICLVSAKCLNLKGIK